jgi:hypothetical protein
VGSSVILPAPGQPKKGPDPAFKTAAIPNLVTFGLDRIGPPSPLYIQRDDVLGIEVTSSVAETVTVNWRQLLAPFPRGGQPDAPGVPDASQTAQSSNVIEPSQKVVNITAAQRNTPQTFTVPLTEGYLLGVTAVGLNSVSRGQCFVRVVILRGALTFTSPQTFQTLFADYVTQFDIAGWPGGRVSDPNESTGLITSFTFANPAAGADFSVQSTPQHRWRLQSLTGVLTTSAAAGNRQVHVRITDGTPNILYDAPAPSVQAASLAVRYSFVPGLTSIATVDGSTVVPLPPNLVMVGSNTIVTSATTGLLAGDQWSLLAASVEDWLTQI